MQSKNLNLQRLHASSRCFEDSICDNPMIMFHGTSNICEKHIDDNGFESGTSKILDLGKIEKILRLFEGLRWWGENQGGAPVLSIYSKRDYENNSPIFFAESSLRALLYASRDFAGGESMRAAFYALSDLKSFISNQEVRNEHYKRLRKEKEELSDAHPSFLKQLEPTIDLDELVYEYEKLTELKQLIIETRNQYEYGVVYAVDVHRDLSVLPHLNYLNGNGIAASCNVDRNTLIAKCIIPKSYSHNSFLFEDNDRLSFIRRPHGLFSRLKSHKNHK